MLLEPSFSVFLASAKFFKNCSKQTILISNSCLTKKNVSFPHLIFSLALLEAASSGQATYVSGASNSYSSPASNGYGSPKTNSRPRPASNGGRKKNKKNGGGRR